MEVKEIKEIKTGSIEEYAIQKITEKYLQNKIKKGEGHDVLREYMLQKKLRELVLFADANMNLTDDDEDFCRCAKRGGSVTSEVEFLERNKVEDMRKYMREGAYRHVYQVKLSFTFSDEYDRDYIFIGLEKGKTVREMEKSGYAQKLQSKREENTKNREERDRKESNKREIEKLKIDNEKLSKILQQKTENEERILKTLKKYEYDEDGNENDEQTEKGVVAIIVAQDEYIDAKGKKYIYYSSEKCFEV